MRKLISSLFLILICSSFAHAQWTKGWNFRATSGYCTDPANTTYAICGDGAAYDAYPTTRNSVTFGYTDGAFNDCKRDRNNAIDCRLAGRAQRNDATTLSIGQAVFRVDLPNAGTYKINLAMGDGTGSGTNPYVQIYDNATLKNTVSYTGTVGAGQWADATGVLRTSAALWVSDNAFITVTFATTTFFLKYANSAGTGSGWITHLNITEVPVSAAKGPGMVGGLL